MFEKARRYAMYPILFKKQALKALIRYLMGKDKPCDYRRDPQLDYNPMDVNELERDAKRWISGWKKQFGIADFDAALTDENRIGREYRVGLMRNLIDFCEERGYKPVYVIPPVTEHLAKYFTPKFEERYIYDYLKDVGRDVVLLDYSKDKIFRQDDSLYFNSFFLNRKGRQLFTRRVLEDLGIKLH